MTLHTPLTRDGSGGGAYPRRWLAAVVMMVAAIVDLIDGTIVNVALPTIRRDLGASAAQLEWVVSAYMLAFAAALITAGSLGDLLGRKRLFLVGTAAFGARQPVRRTRPDARRADRRQGLPGGGSGGDVAPGARHLPGDVRRQGARPPPSASTARSSGSRRRSGSCSAASSPRRTCSAGAGGPCFLVNVPITLGSLIAAIRVVPETRAPSSRRPDLLGAAVLAVALVAIVYPMLEGRRLGWPAWGWGLLAAGVVALVALAIAASSRLRGRGRAAPAAAAPAHAGVRRRADRAARLLDRHAGVRPGVRPVGADSDSTTRRFGPA